MDSKNSENELVEHLKNIVNELEPLRLFTSTATPITTPVGTESASGGGTTLSSEMKHISLSDWSGVLGSPLTFKHDDIANSLELFFKNIDQPNGADNWMSLCKTIVETDGYPDIFNEYVLKSENRLYSHCTSTELKQYVANGLNQLFFNLVRVHVHANVGNYEVSQTILQDLYDNWVNNDVQYQTPIVYFRCVTAICCGNYDVGLSALNRLYTLIKFADSSTRHCYGMWDDWVSALIVCWYVSAHCVEFERKFMSEYNITHSYYKVQRKRILIQNLSVASISQLVTQPYYKKLEQFYM